MTAPNQLKPLYIEAISVYGPGFSSWEDTKAKLITTDNYEETAPAPVQSKLLSSAIKRRTTQHMHVAIQAAEQALEGSDVDRENLELVFASAEGDLNIAHDICYALTLENKPVSPQKFQNVILNAAAGHLGIILKNTAGSTSVTGAVNSVSVGLLQAYTTAIVEEIPVLFVAHDAPSILEIKPDGSQIDAFSIGFLFKPFPTEKSFATIQLQLDENIEVSSIKNNRLTKLIHRTPCANVLPLLSAIANEENTRIILPYSNNTVLSIEVAPCH